MSQDDERAQSERDAVETKDVVWGSEFGVQGSEFRVQSSEFRDQSSGFRVQG